jgi:hypothetical protein
VSAGAPVLGPDGQPLGVVAGFDDERDPYGHIRRQILNERAASAARADARQSIRLAAQPLAAFDGFGPGNDPEGRIRRAILAERSSGPGGAAPAAKQQAASVLSERERGAAAFARALTAQPKPSAESERGRAAFASLFDGSHGGHQ